ncbi:branched-chain amino acid ABC transporter permease [Roseomonas sp. CCTCC AB2023176]|uniref:branched-chain amino acid ABC transporter permease n=1 Tax=Roseomonas sp. CCTCC AB2023176 TaxID=3342640 RepID=UPI0035D7E089
MGLLLAEQVLNGLQYAALLFLLASGLTLIFGVMNVINLTHGSFYMVGAFTGAWAYVRTGSFGAALVAALAGAAVYGIVIERLVMRHLYRRDHLDQVLATFGLTLFTNELVSLVFGRTPPRVDVPGFLRGTVEVLPGLPYPLMRLALIGAGLLVGLLLWLLISRTRLGMLVRAGADDQEMVDALGVDTRLLFAGVFAIGALLCGFAGAMAAPLLAVEVGMGERILITTFVVIVVGGVGSIRGAALGAFLLGMADSFGRTFVPPALGAVLPGWIAADLAAGLVTAIAFAVMAIVLIVRPKGLLG